jgi:hypothetical protein
MIVYTFDYETGAYTGPLQLTAVDIDPRSHCWMIPGNATTEPPPRCDVKTVPIRRNDRWEVYECIAEVPDKLLAQCRAGMSAMKTIYPTEKVK